MEKENKSIAVKDKEVLITHLFNAPVSLVFDAFTDPKHLIRWFAPNGCSISYKSVDVSVGGKFHSCISDPKNGECWCIGEYKEIIKNKKIVYEIAIADENGNLTEPASIGMDAEWPMKTLVSITFKKVNEQTEITLHQTVSEKVAKRTGAHPSWIQSLEKLQEILITNKL